MTQQSNDPLHGVTLEALLTKLVAHYGWEALGRAVNINCFKNDPSIKSSLKFLRRTPWARQQVEALYLDSLADMQDKNSPSLSSDPWGNWHKK